jgi:hypothetical protein
MWLSGLKYGVAGRILPPISIGAIAFGGKQIPYKQKDPDEFGPLQLHDILTRSATYYFP